MQVEAEGEIGDQEEKENEERTQVGFDDYGRDDEQQTIYEVEPQSVSLHEGKAKQAPHALKSLMKSISNSKSKFNEIFDKDFVMTDAEV